MLTEEQRREVEAVSRKLARIQAMRDVLFRMEYLINATPTSEARNLLTEANITLLNVKDLPEFTT